MRRSSPLKMMLVVVTGNIIGRNNCRPPRSKNVRSSRAVCIEEGRCQYQVGVLFHVSCVSFSMFENPPLCVNQPTTVARNTTTRLVVAAMAAIAKARSAVSVRHNSGGVPPPTTMGATVRVCPSSMRHMCKRKDDSVLNLSRAHVFFKKLTVSRDSCFELQSHTTTTMSI